MTDYSVKDVETALEIQDAIDKLTAKLKALKDKIKASETEENAPEKKRTKVIGSAIVEITPVKKFDSESFEINYPSVMYPEYYTLKLDQKKIEEDLAKKYKNTTYSLSIKRAG